MDSDTVEDQASLTVRFLQDQAAKLQTQIQAIEGQVTDLKGRNGSALAMGGGQMIDTGTYSAQIFSLENQNRQLLVESKSRPDAIKRSPTPKRLWLRLEQSTPIAPGCRRGQGEAEGSSASRPETTASPDDSSIQEQIRANNDAIAQLRAQREAAVARATTATAAQAKAPVIMEQASQLESNANGLRGTV